MPTIKEKRISDSHHEPWFNDKIKSEIVLRRKKEKNLVTRSIRKLMEHLCPSRHVANIIKMAQWNYYKEIIHENYNNYKAIFNIANSLI